MCGVAGYIRFNGEAAKERLQKMGAVLTHRGPDNTGIHIDGPMGMVHTRLSIIDLAGGGQPLVEPGGGLSLVANGEIYNYIELRKELQKKGCVFQTRSDSETILHAYSVYGLDFLAHLNGMFAFALYDSKKRQVILARDRLGIKPLYYAHLSDKLAFASEIKALAPLFDGRAAVNPSALAQYLQKGFIHGEDSLFRGVKRVLPGEALVISASSKIERRRYWSVLDVKPVQRGYEEARETFDELIQVVMREHVRSDVPYGLFLSGGADSAILLSQLVQFQDKPIRTFSIGYESTSGRNELSDAERMANLFNTDHTSFLVSNDQMLRRIPFTTWAADDLMMDYANLPTSVLSERASRELKVVFTGEGGDESFAGYGRYRTPSLRRFIRKIRQPGMRGVKIVQRWSRRDAESVFGSELMKRWSEFRNPYRQALQSMPGEWSSLQCHQASDIMGELLNKLIVKVDRMLMSFGLEGRVPWLDHRVVEFGLSLPDALKIDAREGKTFVKNWAGKVIPPDHLSLKKRGFHMPAGKLLSGPFLPGLGKKLLNNEAIQSWFVPDGVRDMLNQQKADQSRTREIWSLMQFAVWHFLFIERPDLKPSPDEDPLDWIS